MNFEFFIARRVLKSDASTTKLAKPVIRISVWAIALGVLIMILALATGNGLRKEIKSKITGFGGDIQILNYQPNPTYEQTPVQIEDSTLRAIATLPEVKNLQAFGRKAGIIKKGELFEGAILKGVPHGYSWKNFSPYLKKGRLPRIPAKGYSDSVVISRTLAARLKLDTGTEFRMYFVRQGKPPLIRKFTIGGIYQTGFEEIDKSFIVGDLKHVQHLNKWSKTKVGGYELEISEEANIKTMATVLRGMLPYEYDALSARQLNPQLFQWLDLFDINIVIILIIIIAVATVNMSIALLILIMERTHMIGILKSLGAPNFSIQKIFLINAAHLIVRGLFWGNLLGVGLAFLQKTFGFIKLDPSTYYVSQVSIDLNPFHILALNAGTLVICLICLLLPSYLIARISPVKAIRFD